MTAPDDTAPDNTAPDDTAPDKTATVLEHVLLEVVPDLEVAFETAFDEARHLVAGSPGCRSVRLSRCVEEPHRYLLLIEWNSLDDHVVGFRQSEAFTAWRGLLAQYWDPLPTVLHFVERVAMDGCAAR
jgi:heme-degrading monooxygenase HmoA